MGKLKCWKKITLSKNSDLYKSDDEITSVFVGKGIKSGKWKSIIEDYRGKKNIYEGNSKYQSLKFAKSYMKKHDKC